MDQVKDLEVILVHDGAIDHSADVISSLAAKLPFVVPLWLSRNFGQHAATLAGMSRTYDATTREERFLATNFSVGALTPSVGPMLKEPFDTDSNS